jgi:hypothetical protein
MGQRRSTLYFCNCKENNVDILADIVMHFFSAFSHSQLHFNSFHHDNCDVHIFMWPKFFLIMKGTNDTRAGK